MILPRFEFREPRSVEEVCSALQQGAGRAMVVAGGTDLLVNMKKKLVNPGFLLSLGKIIQLKGISRSDSGGLRIGSLVTMAELAGSKIVRDEFPALAKAASTLGTPQIRNRATIGGNVCSARPAADTLGPLIAYGAKVRLMGSEGERPVSIEELIKGPGETILGPTEILTDLFLPPPLSDSRSSYIKMGLRKAAEIAIVSVTTVIALEPANGHCKSARVVLGAVAPVFIRCPESEQALMGRSITEDLATQAGVLAAQQCKPISDMRGPAEYRRMLVETLTKRAILESIRGIKAEGHEKRTL
jgi:carbon-monoxide dehydrogenase medium subunit